MCKQTEYFTLLHTPSVISTHHQLKRIENLNPTDYMKREQLFFFVRRVWVEAKPSDSVQKRKMDVDHSEMLNISELQANRKEGGEERG